MQPCVRCHCNHRAIRSCLILGLPRSGRFTLGIESQPRQRSFFWTTNRSNQTNVGFSVFLFVVFVLFVVKPSLQPVDDSLIFERYSLPSRLSILGIVSLDRQGLAPKVCLGIARPSHLAICALWQDSDLHRPNPFVLSMSCMLRWSIVSVTR